MKIAEVFELSHGVGFRIPKRRGDGFVKSCTGWHSLNKQGKHLRDLLDKEDFVNQVDGDFADLDGYLFISVYTSEMCYVDKANKVKIRLMEIIKEVFPFIDNFNEVSI